jgi:hypothetical protein
VGTSFSCRKWVKVGDILPDGFKLALLHGKLN